MLNITLAEVTPGNTVSTSPVLTSPVLTSTVLANTVAEVYAPPAPKRPLAGFGAGAFPCDGAWVGSSANQLTARPVLPRVRSAAVRPVHARTADAFGGAFRSSSVGSNPITIGAGMADTRNGGAQQLNQSTRIYPVSPGGVGPHPAREPDPV
ncbi:MAG TPA: hypothetical protein VMA72_26005 [Streptosporangiaceae bacterium]|nr:hypothetical protein [Streptosporangiaceae bacterium]